MEQTHLFRRQLKIDDYEDPTPQNIITIIESSHPMYGTGSKVWESSLILAKTLAFLNQQKTQTFKGKSVLQLGCGAGLLSIYLAALGAFVTASDLPIVQKLVDMNISNNRIITADRIKFMAYNWYMLASNRNDKWTAENTKFDYIVASEPFISKQAIKAFLRCLRQLLNLNKPYCKAYVAFKIKDNDLIQYAKSLQQNGLHQQSLSTEDMHPQYADPRHGIYIIRPL